MSRRALYDAMDRVHSALAMMRVATEDFDDPEAMALLAQMEFGALAPMRKLRLHLNIPYDWAKGV
jgi:hypothetical protein